MDPSIKTSARGSQSLMIGISSITSVGISGRSQHSVVDPQEATKIKTRKHQLIFFIFKYYLLQS